MDKKKEDDLQKIQWLLEKEDSKKKKDEQSYIPFYGDVTELNTERTILDLVGKDTLEMLCADTMDFLDTSVAIYEKNGDYAYGLFFSGWCQLMDAASRKLCNTKDNQKALSCGKWLCHENCWHDSAKQTIKTGKPTDIACIGGINLYAEPIYAHNQVIGTINIGYGNPPTDEKTLKELSQKYRIDFNTLLARAKEYRPRPPFIIDIAKKRLHNIALLIGKSVESAQNERKLQESEKQFKTITEGSADAIFITDQKGNYVYVNQAVSELLGYSREEMINKNIIDISPPEEIRENVRDFQRLLQGEKVFKEINLIKKEGSSVPIDLHAILLPNGFIYGSCRDITERKQAEEALQESEESYRAIIEQSIDGIVITDQQAKVAIWNKSMKSITGIKQGDAIGKPLWEIQLQLIPKEQATPELLKQLQIYSKNIFESKIDWPGESREQTIICADGTPKVIQDSSFIIKTADTNRFGTIMRDITERKKIEQAMRKSQQEFASLFQSNPEATIYLNKKGNIQNVNFRFTELFGYTLEEIRGKNIDSGLIQPPDKMKESKELTQKTFKGDYISIETIRKKKDGTLFPVLLSTSHLYIEGKYQGAIGIYQDISGRKKIEEQLEKLARIDSLTGCYSRKYGLELLDRQIKLSQRNKSPLLLAFLDIDNFKTINDTFGHNEGDQVLKEVVGLFKSSLREVDIICRMGGDEFLLAFPDSSLQEVPLIRDRLKKKLTQLNKDITRDYTISLSMGFSEYLADKAKNSDDLISIADRRMYEEKKKKEKEQKDDF